jgi:hypothetical protein
MEPPALELIEEELRRRGVTAAQQVDHAMQYLTVLHDRDGLVLYCDYCEYQVPAVWRGWRWYRYLGLVPLFPIRVTLCAEHAGIPTTPRCEPQRDQNPDAPARDSSAAITDGPPSSIRADGPGG